MRRSCPGRAGRPIFIGDYNGIAAAEGRVYPFYQDARSGLQDVYVALVPSPLALLFADRFESGDLSAWTTLAADS